MSGPEQLFADDFAIGQRFAGQTMQLDDVRFSQFASLSGDRHPIHYDDAYAAKSRFGKRLAHGLLVTAITALGATELSARLEKSMIAFLDHGMRFLAPVFVNDSVTTSFTVKDIALNRAKKTGVVCFEVTVGDDVGKPLAEGFQRYLLRCREG